MYGYNQSMILNKRKSLIWHVNLQRIAVTLLVMMSFSYLLFSYSVGSRIYMLLVLIFVLLSIMSGKLAILSRTGAEKYFWIIAMVGMLISYFYSDRSYSSLLDVSVLFLMMLYVLTAPTKIILYNRLIFWITAISFIYALTVYLQFLTPGLFNLLLNLFPSEFRAATLSVAALNNGYTGFTVNAGFVAGYICSGILAICAQFPYRIFRKSTSYLLLGMLFVALLLTGKRGPLLFVILSVILSIGFSAKSKDKFKLYWRVFLAFVAVIIVYLSFRDILINIPAFNRIVQSIEGVLQGEDITSGRSKIYAWGLILFQNNPLFGIGWGTFRTTTAGHATYVKELDAHNIYLQLLCETGIVGFLSFVIPILIFWFTTKKLCSQMHSKHLSPMWKSLIMFSFMYQTFFLLYGLTGNVLYDQHYQIIYFISCAVTVAYQVSVSRIKVNTNS